MFRYIHGYIIIHTISQELLITARFLWSKCDNNVTNNCYIQVEYSMVVCYLRMYVTGTQVYTNVRRW